MTQTPEPIASNQWLSRFTELHARGLTWFDFLTVIDRGELVEIVARVKNSATFESAMYSTQCASVVDSLAEIYPGAVWYEREAHEMFGVLFTGLADTRPLLSRELRTPPPMRKVDQS